MVLVAPHTQDEQVGGVRVKAVAPARSRGSRMTRTAFAVAQAAAAERARIYHLHDPELLLWAPMLRRHGATVVFDMHEHTPVAMTTKHWLPPWARRPMSWLVRNGERILMSGMPVVFAEDAYTSDYRWVRRSAVVLNMPPSSVLAAVAAPKHPVFTLGYFGVVEPRRGVRVMLEAAEILAGRGRQVAVELVGNVVEPFRDELAAWQSKASFTLRAHGRLKPELGWAEMARCHVGLAVLQATRNNQMSYPTKLFEYMALGLPVIASDFPLYRNVVGTHEAGFCIDPHKPELLADKIEWLMDHPAEAEAMGRRGQAAAERYFNWKHEAAKLLRFYEELLAPPRERADAQEAAPS